VPTFDQEGNQVDQVEISFPVGVTITRAVVRNTSVSFFADAEGGEPAFVVERDLSHPGAGLAFDVADWVTTR
jgi:hypothetical protein